MERTSEHCGNCGKHIEDHVQSYLGTIRWCYGIGQTGVENFTSKFEPMEPIREAVLRAREKAHAK
jgi:hypothetical protein